MKFLTFPAFKLSVSGWFRIKSCFLLKGGKRGWLEMERDSCLMALELGFMSCLLVSISIIWNVIRLPLSHIRSNSISNNCSSYCPTLGDTVTLGYIVWPDVVLVVFRLLNNLIGTKVLCLCRSLYMNLLFKYSSLQSGFQLYLISRCRIPV